ncbi:MAG: nitrophenyl compound nitroreductase subunit ArsF family protein [bacterium]
MKKQNIFRIFAIAFLLIGSIITASATEPIKKDSVRIDVTYFHATMRCAGCLAIEEITESTMKDSFARELKDSTITYSSVDFLAEGNEHFQDDYKFDVQTLIISKKVNGKEVKWKNLEKIWDLYSNPGNYTKYVESEIRKLQNSKD